MERLKKEYLSILKDFDKQKSEISRLWNVEKETAELLSFLSIIKKPKTVLELGTSNGFSTFHLAINKESQIITIDIENSRQYLAKKNLKTFNNIVFINDKIEDCIDKIKQNIDFLFIDANKSNYLLYLKCLEEKLSNEAIIIADNIDSHPETTNPYYKYVTESDKYLTIHLSIDAGLLISMYKKNY